MSTSARPKGLTYARNIPAWQLATLPNLPQYCRATPADFRPGLGKSLPSSTHTASEVPAGAPVLLEPTHHRIIIPRGGGEEALQGPGRDSH